MPKIIDGLQKQILKEAKYQIFKNGFSKMTIRSVAKACDIAVGTIYNYYPSKEFLTGFFYPARLDSGRRRKFKTM